MPQHWKQVRSANSQYTDGGTEALDSALGRTWQLCRLCWTETAVRLVEEWGAVDHTPRKPPGGESGETSHSIVAR